MGTWCGLEEDVMRTWWGRGENVVGRGWDVVITWWDRERERERESGESERERGERDG